MKNFIAAFSLFAGTTLVFIGINQSGALKWMFAILAVILFQHALQFVSK